MNVEKTYDYIIYSAGLASVLTSLELSKKGKSVLLLNFYGFMGGTITESLNCFQSVDENQLNVFSKNILNKIKSEKHGILFQDDNNILFNPETIKIVLQTLIEDSDIGLLFHIVPFYLKQKENLVELSLTGKEGIFLVNGKIIIDASDEYELLKLENVKRNLTGLYCNMFLTGLKDDFWKGYDLLFEKVMLHDGRYWVSLKLPKPENEFFIENHSQKIINEFEEVVHKSGGRLQLIPPQTQKVYLIDKKKISKNIFHIDSLLNQKYESNKIFTKTSELESKMSLK